MSKVIEIQLGGIHLDVENIYWIWNARQHYSVERLAERARNRELYFDTKYPDRRIHLV